MKLNIPTVLTLGRILLIPLFVIAFYLPVAWAGLAAAGLFALAAITDWLDGYLARRMGQISRFGAFLDPVADKLIVAVALVMLLQADPRVLLALPVAVIIGREITVSALREWMAEIGSRASVAVSIWGKIKTAVQMTAIVIMLLGPEPLGLPSALPVYGIGLAGLYFAAALTLWSMCQYLVAAWPAMREDSRKDD